jgi:hypothetical protein
MSRLKWAALVVLLACVLLLPCTQEVRDGEGWVRSAVSLHQIAFALRAYHEDNGHLPPAVVRGKNGQPLYSWRVLLLPYLDDDPLFQEFRHDEPWDSEHNKKLLERTRSYQPALGSDDDPGLTRYQVFVGPGTAFERDGLTWADFPKGLADTLLVVEAAQPVPWSKPADLTYDPAGPLPALRGPFGKPVHLLCYELWQAPGFNACFADGSTRFIASDTDEKTIRGLINRGVP